MAFAIGNTVTPRGQTTPVMTVQSVDNVLGNAVCNFSVAGVIQTALYAQENLQIAGVPPAVNLQSQQGLKIPYDPVSASNILGSPQNVF